MEFNWRDTRGKTHLVSIDEITQTSPEYNGMVFRWSCETLGFGEVDIALDNGRWQIDTEYMGRDFAHNLLACWLSNCEEV